MELDLHGYHPNEIDVADLLKQAWETGADKVTLIHGHGRKSGTITRVCKYQHGLFWPLRSRGN